MNTISRLHVRDGMNSGSVADCVLLLEQSGTTGYMKYPAGRPAAGRPPRVARKDMSCGQIRSAKIVFPLERLSLQKHTRRSLSPSEGRLAAGPSNRRLIRRVLRPERRTHQNAVPLSLSTILLTLCLLFLCAPAAWAHGDEIATPGEWWKAWDWHPGLLLGFALAVSLYGRGLSGLWRRVGVGRGVTRAQAVSYAAGIFTLFIALVSPLDALSAELSSAHMGQHMLIMMVAAPLLAFGTPLPAFLWALPAAWRKPLMPAIRRVAHWYAPGYTFWQPVVLWMCYAVTLWLWHMPALYGAALAHSLIHNCQHLAFLLTSWLFWRVLLDPVQKLRLRGGAGVLYLFTTCLHASALGIYMTLSPRLWYAPYAATVSRWHLSALEDQQLAGLIMWIPGCMLYVLAAAFLFAAWLREAERRQSGTGYREEQGDIVTHAAFEESLS